MILTKEETTKFYKHVETQFTKWAKTQDHIRLAMVVGSRARKMAPADQWSDLDIVIFSTDPGKLIDSEDWVNKFGNPVITFIEPTAGGSGESYERRVLYNNGLDVDFAVDPFELMLKAKKNGITPELVEETANVIGRGIRVLIDKDKLMTNFLKEYKAIKIPKAGPPTEHEYLERVKDFWYHTVWAAKKIRRGELWEGKACLDCFMKGRCLLPMIEWHARLVHFHGYDTWFRGRFMERWADPRIIAELRGVFAHYDEEDVWQALANTMQLFRWMAKEVAEKLDFTYPKDADQFASRWVDAAYWDQGPND
ncbi:MAG: aminoglycoside 6-adenylyltransferase [Promethearchaeota archaeon]